MTEGQKRAKYLRLGERSVGGGAPENDNAPAVMMTRGELRELVRQELTEALGGEKAVAPALLTREQFAGVLGCSPSYVDKLRRAGIPHLRLGDSPRFELEPCLAWLRKDGAA